jgi:DNA transformation protein and related proteins
MSVSANYVSYVVDQLSRVGAIRSRRMFGGIGLYCDDLFFGLIDDDVVYLKVDDSNRDDYTSRGCEAFRPFADDPNAVTMSYHRVPEEVLEDADNLRIWARKSVSIAAAAASVKAARKARKTSSKKRVAKPARSKAPKKTSTRKK